MKRLIAFLIVFILLPTPIISAENYHRINLAYTHPNLEKFNDFISKEISTTFSERGTQLGYHYFCDLGFIPNLKMGVGINIDSNWAKRKGVLRTRVYLTNFSADMGLEYSKRLFGVFNFGVGVTGGVSALGYLRMKLLKKNMWRYYWDIEPYINLSLRLGFFGDIYFTAGYHFRTAIGDWTEGGKSVKKSSGVLDNMNHLRLALGLIIKF